MEAQAVYLAEGNNVECASTHLHRGPRAQHAAKADIGTQEIHIKWVKEDGLQVQGINPSFSKRGINFKTSIILYMEVRSIHSSVESG